NPTHWQHAHGTAGAMNQLDVGRQQIGKREAIDRVGVAAADLHDSVPASWVDQRAYLGRRLADERRIAELVHVFHELPSESNRYPSSSCIAASSSPSIARSRSCSLACSSLIRLIAKPT